MMACAYLKLQRECRGDRGDCQLLVPKELGFDAYDAAVEVDRWIAVSRRATSKSFSRKELLSGCSPLHGGGAWIETIK